MQFDCNAHAGITEWRKVAGMASMMYIKMAPHHEPVLHGHLLASIPNGFILESFANPERDGFWFELYDRKPRIHKSGLYLDDNPGFGVEFNQKALQKVRNQDSVTREKRGFAAHEECWPDSKDRRIPAGCVASAVF